MSIYNPNLHTFSLIMGLNSGFPINHETTDRRFPGKYMLPRVDCGERYLPLEKRWMAGCNAGDRLQNGTISLCEPQGKPPFLVIDEQGGDKRQYVLIDDRLPSGFRWRVDIDYLRAFSGIVCYEGAVIVEGHTRGAAVIAFDEGGVVDCFLPDGQVKRLVCDGRSISEERLDLVGMTHIRVAYAGQQLAEVVDPKRRHGILGGFVRLMVLGEQLRNQGARPLVRDVIRDLLTTHISDLTDAMRREVRGLLLRAHDPYAGSFMDGEYPPGVVRLDDHRPGNGTAAKQREQLRRKQARSAEGSTKVDPNKKGNKAKQA